MPHPLAARAATTALIAGLLVAGPPSPAEARDFKPWGSTSSKNHVLKRGCHDYTYRYRITPPTEQWSAEIFFVGPGKLGLGSGLLDSAIDPKRGTKTIEVCRATAPYGRYKMRMKVTFNRDREVIDGFVRPSFFRFTRR
jgi:hypothetical protein